MTPKKTNELAGRRPDVAEAVLGWARSQKHGAPDFELYCSRVVDRALVRMNRRGYDESACAALLLHMVETGKIGCVRAFFYRGERSSYLGPVSHDRARLLWYALRQEIDRQACSVPSFMPSRVVA